MKGHERPCSFKPQLRSSQNVLRRSVEPAVKSSGQLNDRAASGLPQTADIAAALALFSSGLNRDCACRAEIPVMSAMRWKRSKVGRCRRFAMQPLGIHPPKQGCREAKRAQMPERRHGPVRQRPRQRLQESAGSPSLRERARQSCPTQTHPWTPLSHREAS